MLDTPITSVPTATSSSADARLTVPLLATMSSTDSSHLASPPSTANATPYHVPIPRRGVDYRNKIVLAPMVRSGELPSRLLALKYGADLVWGPETVDRALIGCAVRTNPRTSCIEFSRVPSNGVKKEHKPQLNQHVAHYENSPTIAIVEGKDNTREEDIAWTALEPPPPPPPTPSTSDESVIYRIQPALESKQLIFQLGTASPTFAVQAATLVAPFVAGIDVNAGCPKPFSTSGGMGAALLSTPDLLCNILTTLVEDVGKKFEIGISVKIRLLATEPETRMLVERLVKTGITGLTIHCRTRSMRKTERAIREQLRMVGDVCREAGVACVMNGDVDDRAHAEKLMAEYNVDGGMIATAAEKNSSVFRRKEDGGIAPWQEVVCEYMKVAVAVENRWGNTKFLLAQLMPGKEQQAVGLGQMKNYEDVCRKLAFEDEDLLQKAMALDARLGLTERLTKSEAKAAKQQANQQAQKQKQAQAKQVKTATKHNAASKSDNANFKRLGEQPLRGYDENRRDKRQKQHEHHRQAGRHTEDSSHGGNAASANDPAFHMDLHHDIVAPVVNV